MTPPSWPGEEEHYNLSLSDDPTLQVRGEEKTSVVEFYGGSLSSILELKIVQIVKSNFESDLEMLLLRRSYFTSI